MKDETLNIDQAAAVLGVGVGRVRQLDGVLEPERVGRRRIRIYCRAKVEALAAARPAPRTRRRLCSKCSEPITVEPAPIAVEPAPVAVEPVAPARCPHSTSSTDPARCSQCLAATAKRITSADVAPRVEAA